MISTIVPSLRAAFTYFGLVFGAGFALGIVRTLWLVPVLGERNAELCEMPLMLLAVVLAARFVTGRMRAPTTARLLTTGLAALAVLVVAELGVVVFVRGETLSENLAGRDPISGSAYAASLVVFALAPWLLGRARVPAQR